MWDTVWALQRRRGASQVWEGPRSWEGLQFPVGDQLCSGRQRPTTAGPGVRGGALAVKSLCVWFAQRWTRKPKHTGGWPITSQPLATRGKWQMCPGNKGDLSRSDRAQTWSQRETQPWPPVHWAQTVPILTLDWHLTLGTILPPSWLWTEFCSSQPSPYSGPMGPGWDCRQFCETRFLSWGRGGTDINTSLPRARSGQCWQWWLAPPPPQSLPSPFTRIQISLPLLMCPTKMKKHQPIWARTGGPGRQPCDQNPQALWIWSFLPLPVSTSPCPRDSPATEDPSGHLVEMPFWICFSSRFGQLQSVTPLQCLLLSPPPPSRSEHPPWLPAFLPTRESETPAVSESCWPSLASSLLSPGSGWLTARPLWTGPSNPNICLWATGSVWLNSSQAWGWERKHVSPWFNCSWIKGQSSSQHKVLPEG